MIVVFVDKRVLNSATLDSLEMSVKDVTIRIKMLGDFWVFKRVFQKKETDGE